MPNITSRVIARPANYQPVDTAKPLNGTPPNPLPRSMPDPTSINSPAPPMNVFLRGTLPTITASPDNLRQYYSGGALPQFRFFPVQPLKAL